MKLLHIAECAGGVERYLQLLLPRLEKKGIKQYFICSLNYDESTYCKMVSIWKCLMNLLEECRS